MCPCDVEAAVDIGIDVAEVNAIILFVELEMAGVC